jgi:hypothetical protein
MSCILKLRSECGPHLECGLRILRILKSHSECGALTQNAVVFLHKTFKNTSKKDWHQFFEQEINTKKSMSDPWD